MEIRIGTGENTSKINLNAHSGKNGKSAYEIAVDNGFEGTEEEWLESLKASVTIDNAMSNISTNPVQNRIVFMCIGNVYSDLNNGINTTYNIAMTAKNTAENKQDKLTDEQINNINSIGDIETALDDIIVIQNTLIGGENV